MPAPALRRPNSSTNGGSSGTIAAKNIASMKTIAEARSRRRRTPPTLRGGGVARALAHPPGEHAPADQQREERAHRDQHAGVGGRQRVEPAAEVDDRRAQRDRADD